MDDEQQSAPPAPPSAGVEDELDQMQISGAEPTGEEQEARRQAELRAKALDDAVFNDDDEGPVFINPEDMARMMDFGPDDAPPPDDEDDMRDEEAAGGASAGSAAADADADADAAAAAAADAEELVGRFEEHSAPVYALATHPTDALLVLMKSLVQRVVTTWGFAQWKQNTDFMYAHAH